MTITNDGEYKTSMFGTNIGISDKVTFKVQIKDGLPGITTIEGIQAHKGVWADVKSMQVQTDGDRLKLHIEGRYGFIRRSEDIDLKK